MRPGRSKARFLSAIAIASVALVMMPVRVRAAAPEMSFSPTFLRFAGVLVGQTETLVVVATNNGQSNVTVSEVRTTNSKFKVSTLNLPQVLASGESLAVNVVFTPTAKGEVGGSIILVSNASNRVLYLPMAGSGAISQTVTVSPRNLSFGNVEMGSSSKLTTVLTNTGPRKVTVTGVQTVGTGFSVNGATFPLTLPAGQRS